MTEPNSQYGLSKRPYVPMFGSQPPSLAPDYTLMGNDWGGPAPGMDGWVGNGINFGSASSVKTLGGLTPPTTAPGMMSSFLRQRNPDGTTSGGYGEVGLGVASGLFNAWMGMKNYGLAKKQLAENQSQFALNYDAQRSTTNAHLEARQTGMIQGNGGLAGSGYQSVGEYMNKYGIKGRG